MGEFFYRNGIDFTGPGFLRISAPPGLAPAAKLAAPVPGSGEGFKERPVALRQPGPTEPSGDVGLARGPHGVAQAGARLREEPFEAHLEGRVGVEAQAAA